MRFHPCWAASLVSTVTSRSRSSSLVNIQKRYFTPLPFRETVEKLGFEPGSYCDGCFYTLSLYSKGRLRPTPRPLKMRLFSRTLFENAHFYSRRCRQGSPWCAARKLQSRVAEGSHTPPPSQNRTEALASSGSYDPALGLRRQLPQREELGVTPSQALQPSQRGILATTQPFKLPARPCSQGLFENGALDLHTSRPVKPAVVVQPATHRRIDQPRQVLQSLVASAQHYPLLADPRPDCLGGLAADRWEEAGEILPPPSLGPPRPKGIAQEVEADMFVLPCAGGSPCNTRFGSWLDEAPNRTAPSARRRL